MKFSHPRGFSMIDLLAVMGLMGVLVVCLAKVGAEAARQNQAQAAADHGAQVEDRAVRQLRQDMWETGGSVGMRDENTLWIGRGEEESNEKCHTVTWKILDAQHRILRRTAQFWRGNARGTQPAVLEEEIHEDFLLKQPISFEIATEKFVNPVAWSSPSPTAHAIRLHVGSDDFYLPNRGVFTYGFAVESNRLSNAPLPETAP